MVFVRLSVLSATLGLIAIAPAPGQDSKAKSVEQITAHAKKSLAVILSTGRDGKQRGIGTGFLISPDGLIATNLHVIGEGRPISVQLADGKKHDVTAIHASDRGMDLALVRIDGKNMPALQLADPDAANAGQPIVVVGHPRGLKDSVVSGVLSGKREIDGVSMLQLAIPIEQGNSGGPVLDMEGRVLGMVTMKSLVTANLGFAVPSSALKPLLAKPNPIPMERWLTIGALDKTEWQSVFGGRWRQRAGRIIADGAGSGFGGRTLCLWQKPLPKDAYEVAVQVRLEDEAGAAGLVFHADGGDKHYGFYATGGKLRFTRFDGPDVFSWKILDDFPSAHYRPGDWNHLKVRFEKTKMICFVNDHKVLDVADEVFTEGAVGLCKFREPVAEFKHFQVAQEVPLTAISTGVLSQITKSLGKILEGKPLPARLVDELIPNARSASVVMKDRARQLEQQATQLRKLAQAIHQEDALRKLVKSLQGSDKDIDLTRAALLVAALDNEDLDVEAYVMEADRLAREVASGLPKNADERAKLQTLNRFLFEERGFHGSRFDYYTRPNSYLNEVIDDREGLPITLSILYMELARRLGLNVVGIALPGRFVVRHEPAKGPTQLIDVYEGGKFISDDDADALVRKLSGKPPRAEHLTAATKPAIIIRMLHNLITVAESEQDRDSMLRYLDAILGIDSQAHEERWARAVLRFQAGRRDGALEDCDWLLEHNPPGVDMNRVRELRRILLQKEKR